MLGRYGRLNAVEQFSSNGYRFFRCDCDCGAQVVCRCEHVRSGATRSCGCLAREQTVARNLIHGSAVRGNLTPEFTAWVQMRGRCFNPSNGAYQYYGGRGITVCERWATFENFISDMGPRPSNRHSIDRENVNGDYEPSNCRWATKERQSRNKRNTTLSDGMAAEIRRLADLGVPKVEISRRLGVNYSSVKQVSLGKQWVPEVEA